MARPVCGSCMQPLRGGRCVTTSCSQYVNPNTLTGGSLDRQVTPKEEISTHLDDPKYQKARQKMADRAEDFSNRGKARVRAELRKKANKAIGNSYSGKVSRSSGEPIGEVPEGCAIVENGKGFLGTKYKIVKDPDSYIWKN